MKKIKYDIIEPLSLQIGDSVLYRAFECCEVGISSNSKLDIGTVTQVSTTEYGKTLIDIYVDERQTDEHNIIFVL